jgi:hypothetical protein
MIDAIEFVYDLTSPLPFALRVVTFSVLCMTPGLLLAAIVRLPDVVFLAAASLGVTVTAAGALSIMAYAGWGILIFPIGLIFLGERLDNSPASHPNGPLSDLLDDVAGLGGSYRPTRSQMVHASEYPIALQSASNNPAREPPTPHAKIAPCATTSGLRAAR